MTLRRTTALGFFAVTLSGGAVGCSAEAPASPHGESAGGSVGAAGGIGGTAAGGGAGGVAGAGAGGVAGAGAGGALPVYTVLSGDAATPGAAAPTSYVSTCAVCHGPAGEGVAFLGPELRHPPAAYSNWVVRNGRANTTMLPFASTVLSDAQLSEIQTWLGSLPKPASGEQLYLDFCANCHGPTGMGGPVISSYVTAKARADLNLLVRQGEGMDPSMRFSYMPAEDTAELSDLELEAIGTFLGAL